MKTRLINLTILVVLVALLTVCAGCSNLSMTTPLYQNNIWPNSGEVKLPADCIVQVHIKWVNDVTQFCGNIGACYRGRPGIIYAEHPRSWNDYVRIEMVGHEIMHVCGATHPELPHN